MDVKWILFVVLVVLFSFGVSGLSANLPSECTVGHDDYDDSYTCIYVGDQPPSRNVGHICGFYSVYGGVDVPIQGGNCYSWETCDYSLNRDPAFGVCVCNPGEICDILDGQRACAVEEYCDVLISDGSGVYDPFCDESTRVCKERGSPCTDNPQCSVNEYCFSDGTCDPCPPGYGFQSCTSGDLRCTGEADYTRDTCVSHAYRSECTRWEKVASCQENFYCSSGSCIINPEICDDGIDNNGNRLIDCQEATCSIKSVCKADCPSNRVLIDGECTELYFSLPTCGDGICYVSENLAYNEYNLCPRDCPTCGDNTCNGDETQFTCPQDCGEPVCYEYNLFIPGEQGYIYTLNAVGTNGWSRTTAGINLDQVVTWGISEKDVWSVGDTSLSRYVEGTNNNFEFLNSYSLRFENIWGSDENNIWIGGNNQFNNWNPEIWRWNGINWNTEEWEGPVRIDNHLANLRDLHGSSKSNVWAVGSEGFAINWDGISWIEKNIGVREQLSLHSVWANSPNDVWATALTLRSTSGSVTTTYPGGIFHYDGENWQEINHGFGELSIEDVWSDGKNNAYFLSGDKLLHYDGGTWRLMKEFNTNLPDYIWGFSSDDIWVSGSSFDNQHKVFHWDGKTWEEQDLGTVATLMSYETNPKFNGIWGSRDYICPTGCGNLLIEGSEQCDGSNLNGNSCLTEGFAGGKLGCNHDCTLDTTACSNVRSPGDMNGDKLVKTEDGILLTQYLLGVFTGDYGDPEIMMAADADCSCNNRFPCFSAGTRSDLLRIVEIILDPTILDVFPYEKNGDGTWSCIPSVIQ